MYRICVDRLVFMIFSAVFCFTSIKLQNICVYVFLFDFHSISIPPSSFRRSLLLLLCLPQSIVFFFDTYTFIRALRRQTRHITYKFMYVCLFVCESSYLKLSIVTHAQQQGGKISRYLKLETFTSLGVVEIKIIKKNFSFSLVCEYT